MSAKPDKTAADYMAIAGCPALIMVLVGSLVFFLLQIGYAGQDLDRLRWTLFWFVFAMVLVSRIGIQQSPAAAFGYGLALAGATSIMLTQYLGFLWGVWMLLGIIWWTCNKIVWDCTLIDEEQDASGQGLLQLSRFQRSIVDRRTQVRAVSSLEIEHAVPVAPKAQEVPIPPARLGRSISRTASRSARALNRKQNVHAPGLWVLYFSFAAIPVFGVGELLLGGQDSPDRYLGFALLVAYLTAALGLLLLTSFLGLRRYLRQRFLVMPSAMASSWVTSGAGLAFVVLVMALLLPRPVTPYSLAGLVTKLHSRAHDPSEDQKPSDDPNSEPQNGTQQSSTDKKETSDTQTKSSPQKAPAKSPNHGQRSQVQLPSTGLAGFWKWLPYLLASLLIAFLVIRFYPEMRGVWKSLWGWLRGLRLEKKKHLTAQRSNRQPGAPIRLLSSPFQTGRAQQMSLTELVRYSFDGLRLWAEVRGFGVDPSETPLEFAERLSREEPAIRHEMLLLSGYYSHVAYGGEDPPAECVAVMQSLWMIIGFNKAR